MTLPIEQVHLSSADLALMRPALSWIDDVISRSRWGCWAPRQLLYPGFAGNVYNDQRYNEQFLRRVLQLAELIKKAGESITLPLDAFNVAALALTVRVTLHEKLAGEFDAATAASVRRKLECARKRLKRAAQRQIGDDMYRRYARLWRSFVSWLRYNILCFRRRRMLTPVNMLRRDQREASRQIGREVTVENADHKAVRDLIDVARREIRQKRHKDVRLRALLADPDAARKFFAHYIAVYGKPEWLKREYQPFWFWGPELRQRCDRLRIVEPESESSIPESAAATVPTGTTDALPTSAVAADVHAEPAQQWSTAELIDAIANWIVDEVEPGYRGELVADTEDFLLRFHQVVLEPRGQTLSEVVAECRPKRIEDSAAGFKNFYADWLLLIVTSVNPNIRECLDIIEKSSKLARDIWNRLDPLTRQRKIDAIHRRYFNDCLSA